MEEDLQAYFRCISEISKVVLGCIISVVCQFSFFFNLTFIQRKKNVLLLKISHEPSSPENIEKEGNHSDEALQREEKQQGGKEERDLIFSLIYHQQRLGAYHYHHTAAACCIR